MKTGKHKTDLSENGLKNTHHRSDVLDILLSEERSFTANEIYLRLSDNQNKLSLSTIYRILNIFASKGLVIKTQQFNEKQVSYEAHHIQHKHFLFCLRCSESIPIDQCPVKTLEQALTKKTNYIIVGHKMDIYGYCPRCQKEISSLHYLDKTI